MKKEKVSFVTKKIKKKISSSNTLSTARKHRYELLTDGWSIPLGIPYDETMIVKIKIFLNTDGSLLKPTGSCPA